MWAWLKQSHDRQENEPGLAGPSAKWDPLQVTCLRMLETSQSDNVARSLINAALSHLLASKSRRRRTQALPLKKCIRHPPTFMLQEVRNSCAPSSEFRKALDFLVLQERTLSVWGGCSILWWDIIVKSQLPHKPEKSGLKCESLFDLEPFACLAAVSTQPHRHGKAHGLRSEGSLYTGPRGQPSATTTSIKLSEWLH